MTTTSEKILQKIKESRIEPEPRWHFLLKNQALWLVFFMALVVSALSFAVILEMLVYHDWDIYRHLHKSFLQYLMLSLPYLWIFSMGIMVLVVYYDYKSTKGWYRHRVYRVVFASVGLSVALGAGAFYAGAGKEIDRFFSEKIPSYSLMKIDKHDLWVHPEEGLLAGQIAEIKNRQSFILKDHDGTEWEVRIVSPTVKSYKVIKLGENVKIIGQKKESRNFEAEEIRDWDSKKSSKDEDDDEEQDDDEDDDACLEESKSCDTED